MPTTPDMDPLKRFHRLILIFPISSLFIENESRFLIKFTIITYHLKFIYSLRTGHHLTCVEITKV